MTFSVRSIRQESRVAWLWIAAGMAAAGLLARRRPVFHGLIVGLLLWLAPWILETGMGVCHRLLIGWSMGCGLILCFLILSRIRGEKSAAMPAPAAVAGAALVTVLLLINSQANAEETPVAAADAPAIVVPYDPAKPLAEQNPRQVYVDYAHFQRLWQEARDGRLARSEPPAPAPGGKAAAVLGALYEATLAGGLLKVDAVLTIHTVGEWATLALRDGDVGLPFAGASIAGLTIDGNAAVLQNGSLLVEKPGRHAVRATLQAPLSGDWRIFEMRLPPAPATLVSLTHSDSSLRLRLNGGLPLEVIEKREDGYQWRGTGALGKAASLRMERLPAVTLAAGSERPPLGSVRARLFVTPAVERLDSRIDFAFPGAERRDFSFAFDSALTPVQIDIPNLESWSVRDEAGGLRTLDFRLSLPARESLTAGFLAERSAGKPGDERAAPAIVPVANRQEYTLEILNSDNLDVVVRANGGWARSELQGMGDTAETGFRSAGAYRLAGAWHPLTWSSDERPLHRSAQADYAWKISGGILETTVTFTLRAAEHEDLSSLTIPLPPGATLQTLDGQRLKDWWRAGDSLEMRFAGATAETTTVWLDFTQPVTPEHLQSGLPLPCLTLEDFGDTKGRGVVATGPEIDVRLRLDDKAVFAREVEAERARGDYFFLPPLRVRRGFTFETPVFHAAALLEPVAPQFAVRWVLGAAVQDSWTETQFRVDLEMRQGALSEVRFVMPAGMPEARVAGDKVRETVRTVLADGRAEYRAAFQSPVMDTTALTISVEVPHKDGIALPDLEFPGAVLTERFLIMQNFSAGEIVPDMAVSSGVEPLARDSMGELHFTVQGFSNPLSWRLKPGWKLAAEHRALETTSGPQAVVLWAELTTMLRAEGPEWLRAVYHLQNRALQFLPLRLPEGLELISATVAETPVRADYGPLPDGKPGLLIPLIQTRPGDLAMDVEIVCRSRNASAGGRNGSRTLDDPDIPGVSIQRTLWNVWMPQGWDIDDAGGNMERVEEKKGFMEKLEASFEELESLGSYSRMSRNAAFRANAWQQSDVLIGKMEQTVREKEQETSKLKTYYEKDDGSGELQKARERLEQAKIVRSKLLQLGEIDDARQTAAQPGTSGDSWQWDYNSSYLIHRSRERGSERVREESIISASQALNGSVLSGNAVVQSKNAPSAGSAPAAPPASRRYNAQIAALNASDKPADVRTGKTDEFSAEGVPGKESGITMSRSEIDGQKEMAQSAFNDVRGASRRRIETPAQGQSAATAPVAGLLPSPAAGDESKVTIRPEMPKPLFAGTPLPDYSLAGATPPVAASGAMPVVVKQQRAALPPQPVLKPAGRVSIPVTLAEEGTVHRFRKVNDRASLSLTIKPMSRSSSSRWLAAAVLGAGLGVLWLANRMGRKVRPGRV